MSRQTYGIGGYDPAKPHNNMLSQWDDTTRTHTDYTTTPPTVRPYTAAENAAADADAAAEAERIEKEARMQAADAIVIATLALMDAAHVDGEAWVQPTGAHDAYPLGSTVTHNGKTWESLTPANVWVPGVSGWREVVASGPAAWVQPTGAHDAYPLGAKVTHANKTWTSTVAANIWEPGVYGWV